MVLSHMKYLRKRLAVVLLALAVVSFSLTAQDNTFDCNGNLIITLSGSGAGGGTNGFDIQLNGAAASFSTLSQYGIPINSSGFNSQDGYIYGITSSDEIIRLKADNTFDNLGIPPYLPQPASNEANNISAAGDFDANGIYWIHHRQDQSFYGIDVNNGVSLVDRLELEWHPSTGNSGKFTESIDDLVFDPLDKTAMYTYQRNASGPTATRGHLLRANVDPASPDYGFIFSEGALSPSVIVHMGAMFFDSQGGLFGYGAVGSFWTEQDQLIKIDRDPVVANLVAVGPGASANDGCSCPFSMYVTKATADSYNVCESELMEFEYVIGNTSTVEPEGVTFNDTFPPGFEIIDIQFSEVFGNVAPGTGIGTNRLSITDIRFTNKEVTFNVFVKPSLVSGIYNIQAELVDLPQRFGNRILSDDPESFASNDPTIFIVDYELFQTAFEISPDVLMCEGEIAEFTANIPLTGTTVTWSTGESGPFASTSTAGMITATASLGACFDADTAFVEVVPYPVIDLGADLQPCADDATIIGVPFEQGLTYAWNTGSNNNEILVNSSDTYVLEVDDRGCKTVDSINVDVVLEGYSLTLPDEKLCEGSEIILETNNPYPVTYEWTLPDGSTQSTPDLELTDLQTDESGEITIVMEYLGCSYEETLDLAVLEFPTADLQSVERPCIGDPVLLEVPFDADYTYTWSTGESTPNISVNTTDTYIVNIDNEGCAIADTVVVTYVFEEFQEAFPDTVLCEGEPILFSAANELPVSYEWTFPDGSVSTEDNVSFPIIDESDAGEFSLFMQYNQCIFDDQFIVDVNPQPELDIDREVSFDLCDSLTIDINDVSPGSSIQWTPADISSCQNCESTTFMTTTDQWITVTATDDIGCSTTDSVYLDIIDSGLGNPIHIPNIFSPNGDQNNDLFILQPLCYNILTFQIYDRWGNLVYEKTPDRAQVEWDGHNHVGACTEGVYSWVGEFHFINSGERRMLSGDVTILR